MPPTKESKRKHLVNDDADVEKKVKHSKPLDNEEEDSENDMDDDEGSVEDEDMEFVDQEIQVEFEAYPPHESDFEGLKKLLKQCLLKENINVSEIADHVISLNDLTVVVKQSLNEQEEDDDDEDEVYGVTTVVDLSLDKPFVAQLKAYFKKRALASQSAKLKDVFSSSDKYKIGWIISERYINLPPQLCVPAYDSLVKELNKTKEKQFDYFVLICKVLKAKEAEKKKKPKGQKGDQVIYINGEEELLDEKADETLEFSVADQCDGDKRDGEWDEDDQSYTPFRKIMLFDRASLFTVLSSLKDNI
ncbi:Protein BCCIP -like protein [Halotydeus destructor]|nr:Protein BCCIP -like protein [Halotydeus destructor]